MLKVMAGESRSCVWQVRLLLLPAAAQLQVLSLILFFISRLKGYTHVLP